MGRTLEGRLEKRQLSPDGDQERWAWVGRVAGRKQTLGRYPQMSEPAAREALTYMVGRVRRDEWEPAKPTPKLAPTPEADEVPDIEVLANRFIDNLGGRDIGKAQVKDIEGLLISYVLRHLQTVGSDGQATFPLPGEIGVDEVEALRDALTAEKIALDGLRARGVMHLSEDGHPLAPGDRSGTLLPRGLGPRRVNRAIRSLWRVMDYGASRYGTPNAKQLREAEDLLLVVKTKEGPHLTTGQIHLLLEAAREEEEEAPAKSRHLACVAPIAVLALAGLRLGELCDLRLMDIDTSRRRWRIRVRESKTSAGKRDVPVSSYLQRVLAEHLARRRAEGAGPRDPLFATSENTAIGKDNFRSRQWAATILRTNRLCAERGENPIPGIDLVTVDGERTPAPEDDVRATPHALRRSFITHQARLGTHPKKLMKWVGHADSKVTIEIYERVEDDDDDLDPLTDRDPLLAVLYGDRAPTDDNVVELASAR